MQNDSIPHGSGSMDYLDFELEISPSGGREYSVSVTHSPAGEAREMMHFPYDTLALENRLQGLQVALLRSGGTRRQVPSSEEGIVQEFGRDLFTALLTGETLSRYDVSCREARQQGKGLRLKLRILPPELAMLPWEFLYDPRQAEYVCLSRDNPIVRYLKLPQSTQPLCVTPPLRILGMITSPQDLPSLDIEREKQRMELAVQSLQGNGLVELTWLNGQTWRDLQRAMRGGPWHIFHFIGHGGFDRNTDEGLIVLADENRSTHCLRATELGRLLADHHSLRLVLLNSCEGARGSERDIFSSTAAILVRRGMPAVLAMQYEITDRAATEFARAFYEALSEGLPVDVAVTEARKAVSLAVTNTVEWGTPVLYMRTPQGVIFQLPKMQYPLPPSPAYPASPDTDTKQRFERLFTDGLGAFWVEDWDRACRNFKTILDECPDYPDAAAKLEEAQRQRKFNMLYAQAKAAKEAADWQVALSTLEALVAEAADFKDAAELLETVKKQKQLADLYTEAHKLSQAEQWQAVVNVFAQIVVLDPNYADPEKLQAMAEGKVAALKRQAELDQLYRQAVLEVNARRWREARKLLATMQKLEPDFRDTTQLLARVNAEIEQRGKVPKQPHKGKKRTWAIVGGSVLLGLGIIGAVFGYLWIRKIVIPAPTSEPVTIRWFVGLGTDTNPAQLEVEKAVVDDFNATVGKKHEIQLVLEVVPYDSAKDTLSNEIADGVGPDIIGPIGWNSLYSFYGQWLDITPYMAAANFDTSLFNPVLVNLYQTEYGQVGLPFVVYPSAIFYIPAIFDEAGLNYPSAHYGEQYMLNGRYVDWNWDTLTEVAKLLTLDVNQKNATKSDFDETRIVQYGFTWQYEKHPSYWGSFWGSGTMLKPGGSPGMYQAQAPEVWKAAWMWTYYGIWGNQPFIPSAPVSDSDEYDKGNPFNSGKVAMTDQPIWYTCCMGNLTAWEMAAMPSYNGKVAGRTDADTFHISKDTKHPQETFTVLIYLVTTGTQKLIIGSTDLPAAYDLAIPAYIPLQSAWLEAKKAQFPFVTNWQVILDGLSYPDVPNAVAWMPNYNEAWDRGTTFASLLLSTPGLDIDDEIAKYLSDLNTIFNK